MSEKRERKHKTSEKREHKSSEEHEKEIMLLKKKIKKMKEMMKK